MTEKERFVQRFEEARREDGLVDMKFMARGAHRLTEEEFFAAANAFDDASRQHGERIDPKTLDTIEQSPFHLLA